MRQDNGNAANRATPAVERLDERAVPAASAVGSTLDTASYYTDQGALAFTVRPYGEGYTTGVRATVADVNGDGTPDLITAPVWGGRNDVVTYDGTTGKELGRFQAFERAFRGGVTVAAGDLTGDGRAEIVAAADTGGGPRIRVVSGADGSHELADFMAFDDPNFRGGARVALGDLNADGTPDLVAVAGPGGGARVAGFEGKALAQGRLVHLFPDFQALDPDFRGGATIAATAGGFAVGAGSGGGPRVQTFSFAAIRDGNFDPNSDAMVGDDRNRGGVALSTGPDGKVIVTDPFTRKALTVMSSAAPPAAATDTAADPGTPTSPPTAPPTTPPPTTDDTTPPPADDTTPPPDTTTTPPALPDSVAAGAVAPAAGSLTGVNGRIVTNLKGGYSGAVTVTQNGNTLTGTGVIWIDDVRPRAGSSSTFDFVGVEVVTFNGVARPPRTVRGVYVGITPPAADGTGQVGLLYPNVTAYATPSPTTDPSLDWNAGVITLAAPVPGVAVSGQFAKDATLTRDPALAVLHLPAAGVKPDRTDAAPWDAAAIDATFATIAGAYKGTVQVRGTNLSDPPVAVDLTVTIDKEAPTDWLSPNPAPVFRGTYTMKVGTEPVKTGELVVNVATSTFGAADGTWSNWGLGFLADGTSFGVGAIAFTTPDAAHPGTVTAADIRTVVSGGPLVRAQPLNPGGTTGDPTDTTTGTTPTTGSTPVT